VDECKPLERGAGGGVPTHVAHARTRSAENHEGVACQISPAMSSDFEPSSLNLNGILEMESNINIPSPCLPRLHRVLNPCCLSHMASYDVARETSARPCMKARPFGAPQYLVRRCRLTLSNPR